MKYKGIVIHATLNAKKHYKEKKYKKDNCVNCEIRKLNNNTEIKDSILKENE